MISGMLIYALGTDFEFEFDHLSGHSKLRPDGLSCATGQTDLGFGGKQALNAQLSD